MANSVKVDGNKLTIVIDLAGKTRESKSGKSEIIYSTGGNIPVEGHPEVRLGVNCYKRLAS